MGLVTDLEEQRAAQGEQIDKGDGTRSLRESQCRIFQDRAHQKRRYSGQKSGLELVAHLLSSQDVQMQVMHRLTAALARIDHGAKSERKKLLFASDFHGRSQKAD